MSRAFRCVKCGELHAVETRTGPLPTTCGGCDPERAAQRNERRRTNRTAYRRLRDRVTALEAVLDAQREACKLRQASFGMEVCDCGRDYLTVPLDGPEAQCPHPIPGRASA